MWCLRRKTTYSQDPVVYSGEDGVVVYLDECSIGANGGKQGKSWTKKRTKRRFVVGDLIRQSKLLHPLFLSSPSNEHHESTESSSHNDNDNNNDKQPEKNTARQSVRDSINAAKEAQSKSPTPRRKSLTSPEKFFLVSKASVISQDVIDDESGTERSGANTPDMRNNSPSPFRHNPDTPPDDEPPANSSRFSVNTAPKYAHIDRFVVHSSPTDVQSVSATVKDGTVKVGEDDDEDLPCITVTDEDATSVALRRPLILFDTREKLLFPPEAKRKGWKTKTRDSTAFTDSQKDFFRLLESKMERGSIVDPEMSHRNKIKMLQNQDVACLTLPVQEKDVKSKANKGVTSKGAGATQAISNSPL